jgi:hypothetical protein
MNLVVVRRRRVGFDSETWERGRYEWGWGDLYRYSKYVYAGHTSREVSLEIKMRRY